MAELRPPDPRPVVVRERIPWLTVDRRIMSVPLPSRVVLVWRLAPQWEQPELPGVR